MARRLTAVTEGTPAPTKKPISVTEAAASGDHRELLVAMRTVVAKAVGDPDTPPRDLASLTRRLHELSREIKAIDAAAEQEGSSGGRVADESFDASAI